MILLHFTAVYALDVLYIYCICVVEMLYHIMCYCASLPDSMLVASTQQKSADAMN